MCAAAAQKHIRIGHPEAANTRGSVNCSVTLSFDHVYYNVLSYYSTSIFDSLLHASLTSDPLRRP
jgi:hypothetical protein